jgi:hypothetical protein
MVGRGRRPATAKATKRKTMMMGAFMVVLQYGRKGIGTPMGIRIRIRTGVRQPRKRGEEDRDVRGE